MLESLRRLAPLRAGPSADVVHEHVEAADAAFDLLGEAHVLADRCAVGEKRMHVVVAGMSPELGQRRLSAVRITSGDQDPHAEAGERRGDVEADPDGASGDERGLAGCVGAVIAHVPSRPGRRPAARPWRREV